MADTVYPQNNNNSKEERTRSEFLRKTHGDVVQDKYAPECVRVASAQAQPSVSPARTPQSSKNSDRVQKPLAKRKRVHKAIWVTRPISMMIDQQAALWGVSPSRAGERLIELGFEHNILNGQLHLIVEAIRETLQEECRRFFGRLTSVIFRMYLLVFRIFHLQKNLLSRSGLQNRLTVAQLDKIIAWSGDLAREDVLRKTGARSAALDRAIADWLAAERVSETEQKEETDRQN
jgi:hypothetical protein